MSKQLIFAIYDQKAHAYARPFFLQTEGLAIRELKDAANDPNTSIGRHPEDYTLFCMGTYNEVSGHFDIFNEGKVITKALALVDVPQEDEQLQLPNLGDMQKFLKAK